MKRETPYPQKRQPAKRMLVKEHETQMAIREQMMDRLYSEIDELRSKLICRDQLIVQLYLGEL